MANIKFSQFTEKTTLGTVDFLVGYTGAENVQISPTNLLSTFVSGSGTNGQVAYFDPSNNLTGENAFFWDYTNKRLGIGTNVPNYKVHIKDNSVTTGSKTLLQLQSDPINNGGSLNLDFRVSSANTDDRYVARISGMREGNGALSQLQFWTESSGLYQRMTITSAGNVGIGTNTPSSTLQISGTLDATGISQLGSGGSNVYLTSSSAGNVGIGTSSPNRKLTVLSDGVIADFTSSSTSSYVDIIGSSAQLRAGVFGGVVGLANGTGTTAELAIDTSGNVGIGTASPGQKLDVSGNIASNSIYLYDSTSNDRLVLDLDGSDNLQISTGTSTGSRGITFITENSEKMRITSTGNVGIGNTNPQNTLHLGDNTAASAGSLRLDSFVANQYWKLEPGTNTLGIKDYDGNSLLTLNGSNNSATFAGDIDLAGKITQTGTGAGNAGLVNTFQNPNGGNAAYSAIRLRNDDAGFAEIWRNSSTKSGSGDAALSLNVYNSADVNIWSGANRAVHFDTSQNATFEGTVLIDGVSNYTGLTVKGITSSRPAVNFTNVTQGNLGTIFGTEARAVSIGTGATGVVALTLDASQNATFAGSATIRKSSLGGSTPMADGSLVLGAGSTDYYSFRLDSNADLYLDKNFSGTGANILSIDRSSTNGNITFAGKVGVGIAATDHLEVAGNIRANVSNAGGFMLTGASASGLVRNSATGVALRTNTTDQLIIDNSGNATFAGNVTLSNTGPLLYLANTTSTTGKTWRFSSAANGKFFITQEGVVDAVTLDHTTGNANFAGYIYVNTGGAEPGASQVGVRITGTQGQAFWNSANSGTTGYNHFNFYNGNGAVGSIVTNGSATSFNTSSDYRLKEDLQDFAGLDMVSKISVYDFKWKADESRSYGVMAHELQEVLPQAVTEEKDAEEMQGVDYSKIVPLLVKSIQELKSEIEELKSK